MSQPNIPDELRYQLLKRLEQTPDVSQRELAAELGVSVGKTNYCLKALIAAGLIKAGNFARSKNKMRYAYLLTPQGISEKSAVTLRFLERKQQQYELLKKEIENLEREVGSTCR